ncbi:MAG: BrnT family toxin [Terriglobales bacterium]
MAATIPDPLYPDPSEDRFVTMGWSASERLIVVVHCDRGDRIRIISARRATRRERKQYEEGVET